MAALIQDEFGKVTLRFYHIYKNLTDKIKPVTVYVFLVKFV